MNSYGNMDEEKCAKKCAQEYFILARKDGDLCHSTGCICFCPKDCEKRGSNSQMDIYRVRELFHYIYYIACVKALNILLIYKC